MLQTIRDKPWIAFALLGPIILAMAFFGIGDYFNQTADTYAARIEGPAKFLGWGGQTRDISQEDFRRRFEQFRAQRREQEGDAFDSAGFDTLDNKRLVLDTMIDEEISALAAERDGITVSEAQVADDLKTRPEFQVDGAYSPEQYRMNLAAQQITHAQYMASERARMARAALPTQIVETSFAGKGEVEALLRLSQQTRDLELVDLPTPSLPTEPPPAADLQAWYDEHAANYRTEEQVAIEYIELDIAALPAIEAPSEAILQARYDEQKSRFVTAPRPSVAHLLIAVPADADAATDAAAKERATSLAVAARAPGADFAALVAANSDDLGSKADGGNLGEVDTSADSSFPAPLLQAVATLKAVGDISEPVRTSEGWHVVRLTDLVPGSERPFAEARAELEAEYMATEQERRFSELAARVLEQIYKTPTALAPAAEAVGLPVQRTALFSRSSGEGIAAIEAVRKAAFVDEQRLERKVSDTLEIAPGHVVALHVIEHKPEAAIAFADVQDRVLNDYNADRLAKASQAQAEALLARLQAGETLEALATELGKTVAPLPGIGRQGPMPPDVVEAIFAAPVPAEGARSYGIAKLGADRHVLFAVTKVTPGDLSTLDEPTRAMIIDQVSRSRGIVEFKEYVKALRSFYTVDVAEDRL
jgi:peptidyl-prolyl cis-trans isomerase D